MQINFDTTAPTTKKEKEERRATSIRYPRRSARGQIEAKGRKGKKRDARRHSTFLILVSSLRRVLHFAIHFEASGQLRGLFIDSNFAERFYHIFARAVLITSIGKVD